jgi:hypothetical protein
LNPLKTTFSGDIGLPSHSNGNLDVIGANGGTSNVVGTIGVSSDKFYYECTLTATHDLNACIFGLGQSATAYSNNFGLKPNGSFGGTITSGSAFARRLLHHQPTKTTTQVPEPTIADGSTVPRWMWTAARRWMW